MLATLLIWLWVAWPMASGESTVYLRDAFSNALPQKAFAAEQLKQGHIAALDPGWGLGQPHRGNAALASFHPHNLLYLLLPFWSAFNLHFALHWLIALFTFRALARALGQSPAAAWLATLGYAGGGYVLSTFSFYNLVGVAAWWPLAMAGVALAARGGGGGKDGGKSPETLLSAANPRGLSVRGLALASLGIGLTVLSGDPVTTLLGGLPLLLAACAGAASLSRVQRAGIQRLVRGTMACIFAGIGGALISLPQLIATARIYGASFRGGRGNLEGQAGAYSLEPLRLLELVLPLPFGWPTWLGPRGVWVEGLADTLPFFFSAHFGLVALTLFFLARQRSWQALAILGLAAAVAGGTVPSALEAVSFGLFRFPEKFLFWTALAAPLAAGFGLQRAMAASDSARRRMRLALGIASASATLAALVVFLLRSPLAEGLRQRGGTGAGDGEALAQTLLFQGQWVSLQLALASAALAGLAYAVSRRRASAAVALQLLCLLPLAPLLDTAPVKEAAAVTDFEQRLLNSTPQRTPQREIPADNDQARSEIGALSAALALPSWVPPPNYRHVAGSRWRAQQARCADLHPTPGALHGLSFPLAPNLEGLGTALSTFLHINLVRLDWDQRIRWLQLLGVEGIVVQGNQRLFSPGLEPLAVEARHGVVSTLYRVVNIGPDAWWPQRVEDSQGPVDVFRKLVEEGDLRQRAVVAGSLEHRPGGRVRILSAAADRVELEVVSEGGLAVLRRAYHPLLEATLDDGTAVPTTPVNLALTGIAVPAGTHRITLAVDHGPERLGGGIALLTAIGCLWILRRRRNQPENPGLEASGPESRGPESREVGA